MSEREAGTILLKNISQKYPTPDGGVLTVVDNISLAFDEPGINMLLGPSGCGKSTVLRMMGGVIPPGVVSPTSGQVFIDGKLCNGPHEDAVMVFQRYANRPDLTVWDNVGLPFQTKLWQKRVPTAERETRIIQILKAVGLLNKRDLYPAQLSGGQNQRVALARALVLRPRVLLMDEPFGALDAQTRNEMQRLLIDIWKNFPCQVVFVTHDVDEALLLGHRVVVFSTQPAKVADDFQITASHSERSDEWLRSANTTALRNRILEELHSS